MIAFNSATTVTADFTDVDGRAVTIRPVYDNGLGRVVVELAVYGSTVRLSNGIIPKFSDTVVQAALLGEITNLADGNPSTAGE
ncbi:hypothetical protein [Streptomyces mirabilis]|uniref:hypothetical protein n=1 Tax=Streptomyces mirabilis TaxID=68239 RepID=UPI0036DF3D7C